MQEELYRTLGQLIAVFKRWPVSLFAVVKVLLGRLSTPPSSSEKLVVSARRKAATTLLKIADKCGNYLLVLSPRPASSAIA